MKLDKNNWLILKELQQNGRVSLKEIAHKVGLTPPSIAERIQKMEDAGVIDGFKTKLNMYALGYTLVVYISIKIRFGMVEAFEKFIPTVIEICECHKLTGQDCMLMKGIVKDTKHLEELNKELSKYGELTTSLLLSSIVEDKIYDDDF